MVEKVEGGKKDVNFGNTEKAFYTYFQFYFLIRNFFFFENYMQNKM